MRLLYSTAALFEKQDAVKGGNNISLKASNEDKIDDEDKNPTNLFEFALQHILGNKQSLKGDDSLH